VDRCAGDLVKGFDRGRNGCALVLGKAVWYSKHQFRWDGAGSEGCNEALDAFEQFGGRRLGEGYGDDVARPNAVRQHKGYAPCHQGGLAAAGARLDEQGCAVIEQRAPPCGSIRKWRGVMAVWHHSISQSGARSLRRAVMSGNFRSK
jgi:hypothetical protein